MSLLELDAVEVAAGEALVLHAVSLAVAAGERVALLGANGAGKTSLLRAVMGLAPLRAGRIRIAGEDVTRLAAERRALLGLGYAPEGRRVFPGMTVRDNLKAAARASAAERRRRLDEVHALFPVLAERGSTLAWQLSGGQQQMLAIGRALMTGPRLLLLDEPSLGLAPKLVAEVLSRVRLVAERGVAVLLAEQNVATALALAERGYVLELGRIVEEGAAAALAGSDRLRRAFLGGAAEAPKPDGPAAGSPGSRG
jgi:branched-chain amino acid transport system ATP-binding protein